MTPSDRRLCAVWKGIVRGALLGAVLGIAFIVVLWLGMNKGALQQAVNNPGDSLLLVTMIVGMVAVVVAVGSGILALSRYSRQQASTEEPYGTLSPPGQPLTAAPGEEGAVADTPVDPFEASVLNELEKIRNPKGNWVQALLILAVSLLLFVGLGHAETTRSPSPAMLVGVLLFHEMGHYVGMRIFGYRNVRMFFIPFFGAAVSGQKTDVKSYQEAIVTLLGPLPGLCLAVVLFGVVAFVPGIGDEVRRNLLWASILLGLINGFNLLPVFPLDGGRLLNQILFSRNRYLEGVFQFLAALAFIAYGVAQRRVLLC